MQPASPPLSPARLAAIFELIQQRHYSVPEVAHRLGLTPARLRAYVRRAGIRLPCGRLPRIAQQPPDELCAIAFAPAHPDTLVTPASLPGEEWQFVARNRDYAVSSLGRVCRVTPYTATHPGRELRARVDAHGKATVILARATVTVASLVAAAFLPPPPPGTALYHRDFDATNNQVTNLAWATRREITIAAWAHHRIEGERHPHARLSDADVECIRAQRGTRSAREIAADFGIAHGTVYQIQSGRTRGAAGTQVIHPPALGERIRLVRTQRAMSATEMARHLGVTTSAVTAWERGEKTPRYPIRIATLLAPLEAECMAEDAHGRARSNERSAPSTARGPVRPVPTHTHPAEGARNVFTE